MHEWYDDWPYWDDLYQAMTFIEKEFDKKCKTHTLMFKEKYGTVRYEHTVARKHFMRRAKKKCPGTWGWDTRKSWKLLAAIIKKATEKWPHIKRELVHDFMAEGLLSPELQKLHDSMWTRISVPQGQ